MLVSSFAKTIDDEDNCDKYCCGSDGDIDNIG
jgi:hypothetical protein